MTTEYSEDVTAQKVLVYMLSKAIVATEVDYDRLNHLKADFCLVRDSGHQELSEWKNHNLEELIILEYNANNHTSSAEAREALHSLCINTDYHSLQDPEVQTLLAYANDIHPDLMNGFLWSIIDE